MHKGNQPHHIFMGVSDICFGVGAFLTDGTPEVSVHSEVAK
jgi:hypothetical protein